MWENKNQMNYTSRIRYSFFDFKKCFKKRIIVHQDSCSFFDFKKCFEKRMTLWVHGFLPPSFNMFMVKMSMVIFTYCNKRSRRKFYSLEMECICILMSLLPIGRRDKKKNKCWVFVDAWIVGFLVLHLHWDIMWSYKWTDPFFAVLSNALSRCENLQWQLCQNACIWLKSNDHK